MIEQHAFLPPSGAYAWKPCPMWATMNRLYPKPDTEDSRNGTAAHWAFYEMLYARPVAVGQVAPNGVALTDEMIQAAELYCDVIDRDLAACGLDRRYLQVERRVFMPRIHAENWGTPDTWFYAAHLRRIFLYDFKFGHEFVDAYENDQCIDYTNGIAEALGLDGLQDQAHTVDIVVIQPRNYDRAGPERRWKVTLSDLRAHYNILTSSANLAMLPNPPSKAGKHCKHCPGRHACNTVQRGAYEGAHFAKESSPVNLPPAALVLELHMLEDAKALLDARVSGLQEEVESRVRHKNERMPGYKMVETYGRQDWSVPVQQIVALGSAMGVNVAKPGALTPLQAIKAGLPADLVNSMSGKAKTGVKLVRDDGRDASRVFGIAT